MSTIVNPTPQKIYARGPKVLLMGMEGHGKTDSIRTLIEAGLKVFCVFLEPGHEVLQDSTRGRKVYSCEEGLHWHFIPMASPSWQDLADAAELMNKLSFEGLSLVAPSKRDKFTAFWQLITTMGNLKCDRCGVNFGPADHLPYDQWAVVNDSLTTISRAALYQHIGIKPAVHKGEYGNCMFAIERYLEKFVNDMPCLGVMMAHVDREPNEVTGGTENMVATLGQKLAPKIPRPFSDVILAKRDKDRFSWSTTDANVRLKTRNFAFSDNILPTFVPLVKKWQDRIAEEKKNEAARAASNTGLTTIPVAKPA